MHFSLSFFFFWDILFFSWNSWVKNWLNYRHSGSRIARKEDFLCLQLLNSTPDGLPLSQLVHQHVRHLVKASFILANFMQPQLNDIRELQPIRNRFDPSQSVWIIGTNGGTSIRATKLVWSLYNSGSRQLGEVSLSYNRLFRLMRTAILITTVDWKPNTIKEEQLFTSNRGSPLLCVKEFLSLAKKEHFCFWLVAARRFSLDCGWSWQVYKLRVHLY